MDQLTQYRSQIDTIDTQIIQLLGERFHVVEEIGKYKKQHKMQPLQASRWQEVLYSRMQMAEKNGIDPKWIQEIWEEIHQYALKLENRT